MRDDLRNLSLVFPQLPVGEKETPPDLKRLLYKGGAGIRIDKVEHAIQNGLLGDARLERLELVCLVHDHISGKLAGGGSPVTARNQIDAITAFFGWADQRDASLTVADIQATYLSWAEHLVHRCKVVKDLSERTAYDSANKLGDILDGVLERQKPILHLTRVSKPKQRKAPQGIEAEKQNLSGTFAFGRLLQDICDGLNLSTIWSLRIEIPLQGGGVVVPWTGGSTPRTNRALEAWEVRVFEERKRAFENDHSLEHRGRKAVVNMRILAELLMFIGQTGMNVAQAHTLKLRHFNYSSDIDGYKVRDYKHRRGGEVLFEIFSEYRSHFERYLEWRRTLFPNSEELFPVIRDGSRAGRAPLFDLIIRACKQAGVPWIPPSMLRGTRVNWILRRSGDPDLTAEVAQHHKRTLLEVYEDPSLQRAIGEVTRFWQVNDPALASAAPSRAVAPGHCDGKPVASPAKPETAPSPDCTRPSGCLWCEHHRDIDSLDYVWSLACFRHLKVLEVSKHCFPSTAERQRHPAQHAIDKLSEKLTWFKNSNATRRSWVEEALARVEEGNYHGEWARFIQDTEGTAQ
ncbi:site-specific integrase [Burkholderia pseudomallei]|uniref:site-specific integrase n=1 Tax=Burkholderia pseudomallei TaxID=28450 RepID=UPI0022DB4B3A|nr:site-specific integrase [Burkholderia pseudomallei]MDA0558332.1 site-specific integrase [Burkholderia pseudomallei]